LSSTSTITGLALLRTLSSGFTTVESDVNYIRKKPHESMARHKASLNPGQVTKSKEIPKKRGAVREQDNEIVPISAPESNSAQSRA
jgi:hypothetical protein